MEHTRAITAKAARVNAGIGLQKAADALGIARQTLNSYENGKYSPPWELVERMSEMYNYPIGSLLFARQSPKSEVK